jgi:hypothetical protein|tara:strand:- start:6628 stop:7095 length:468 start_codon:yes stop_codon:yes gene_type:complete
MALDFGMDTLFKSEDRDNVGLGKKTKEDYLSIAGTQFMTTAQSTSTVYSNTKGTIDTNTVTPVVAQVNLPHGCTVTAVILYGNDAGEQWVLSRTDNSTNGASKDDLSAGVFNINQEDIKIDFAQINNRKYRYYIHTTTLEGDIVYGARITYNTEL